MSANYGINKEQQKRISLSTYMTDNNPKYSTINTENSYKRVPATSFNTEANTNTNTNIINTSSKNKHNEVPKQANKVVYDSKLHQYRTITNENNQHGSQAYTKSNTESNKIGPIRTTNIMNIPENERITTYKREDNTSSYQNRNENKRVSQAQAFPTTNNPAQALINRMNRNRRTGMGINLNQNKTSYTRGKQNEKTMDITTQSNDIDLDKTNKTTTYFTQVNKTYDINNSSHYERKQPERKTRGEIVTTNNSTIQYTNRRKNNYQDTNNNKKNTEINQPKKIENTRNTKQPLTSERGYNPLNRRTTDSKDTNQNIPYRSQINQNRVNYTKDTSQNISNNNRLNQNRISYSNEANQNIFTNKRQNQIQNRMSYSRENNQNNANNSRLTQNKITNTTDKNKTNSYNTQVVPRRGNQNNVINTQPTYDRGAAQKRQQPNVDINKYLDKKGNKEDDNQFDKKDQKVDIVKRYEEKIVPLLPGQTIGPQGVTETFEKPVIETVKNKDGSVSTYLKQTKLTTRTENVPYGNDKTRATNSRPSLVKQKITYEYKTVSSLNKDNKNTPADLGQNKVGDRRNKLQDENKTNISYQAKNVVGNTGVNKNENKPGERQLRKEIKNENVYNSRDKDNKTSNINTTKRNETGLKGTIVISDRRRNNQNNQNTNSKPINKNENTSTRGTTTRVERRTERTTNITSYSKPTINDRNNVKTDDKTNDQKVNVKPLNTDGNTYTRANNYQSKREPIKTGPKDTSAKEGKSPYNSIQITDDKGQDKELNFQKKQTRARSGSRKQLRSSLKHGKRRKSAATKRVKFEKPKKK